MPKVLVSYSHDSPTHADRVLALANRLRADGIETVLDQYEEFGPPEGWPRWMTRQIRDADFVLMVCTPVYYARVMGEEKPGTGRGVTWEGNLILQHLLEGDATNRRFLPVLLGDDSETHIPDPLRPFGPYRLDGEQGYLRLYRRLTNQPAVTASAIGRIKSLPPRERRQDFFNEPPSNPPDVEADTHQPGILLSPPLGWVSPIGRNRWRYKLVAFDLDGTLLRGPDFEFSWERVWRAVNVSRAVQNELRREYRRRTESDASPASRIAAYQAWCDAAISHFRKRGLTRDRLRDIASPLALTKNCREVLAKLRKEGVVTAIISGGIDTFLEDAFPDFAEYLDFVFINRLLFEPDGLLRGVKASAFDFGGKADALKLVCQRAGCEESETAFVGDHFNDEAVMLSAHLPIAYPPRDKVADGVAGVVLLEDDLAQILPHILAE